MYPRFWWGERREGEGWKEMLSPVARMLSIQREREQRPCASRVLGAPEAIVSLAQAECTAFDYPFSIDCSSFFSGCCTKPAPRFMPLLSVAVRHCVVVLLPVFFFFYFLFRRDLFLFVST